MAKKRSFFDDLSDSDTVTRITDEQQRKLNDILPEEKPKRKGGAGRKRSESGSGVIDKYIEYENGASNTVVQISPLLKYELEKIKLDTGKSIKQLVAEAVVTHFDLK